MERLRSCGRRLSEYENEAFLDRLQHGYGTVGGVLHKRHRVDFIELDTEDQAIESVLDQVEAACDARLSARDDGHPAPRSQEELRT